MNDKRFKFSYDSTSGKYGTSIDGIFYPFGEGGADVSDTTATANAVLSGYYFYTSEGVKTQGNIVSRSASNITVAGSQTYYSGYYPSNWTVSGLDTSDANATATNIEYGYTAYVNGVKINGSAKITHGLVKYPGVIAELTERKWQYEASENDTYAIFAGGLRSGVALYSVDVYDGNLIKTVATNLGTHHDSLAATSINNYVLFGGGKYSGENATDVVEYYDNKLTKGVAPSLEQPAKYNGAASSSSYAIFAGGFHTNSNLEVGTAYNTSLTKTRITALSSGRYDLGAANVGNYIMFAGGQLYSGTIVSSANSINSSLTRSNATDLSAARFRLRGGSTSSYAIFGGGQGATSGSTTQFTKNIDAYNTSLSKTLVGEFTEGGVQYMETSIYDTVIFGGLNYGTVNAVDNSLSKQVLDPFDYYHNLTAAASINGYAIFGGGQSNSNSIMDVYTRQ